MQGGMADLRGGERKSLHSQDLALFIVGDAHPVWLQHGPHQLVDLAAGCVRQDRVLDLGGHGRQVPD